MVKKLLILLFQIFLIHIAFQTSLDPWRLQNFYGLVLMSLILTSLIAGRTTVALGVLSFYLCLEALRYSVHPISPMAASGMATVTSMDALALGNLVFLLLIALGVFWAPARWIQVSFRILKGLALWNSFFILIHALLGKSPTGLLGNPAMDGCLIACLVPFLIGVPEVPCEEHSPRGNLGTRIQWELLVLPAVAICVTKSITAILALLLAGILIFGFHWQILSVLVLGGVLSWNLWPALWSSNGRLDLWYKVLWFWNWKISLLWGAGPSSFFLYGPHIQMMNGTPPSQLFIWTHNDWLQVLFEYGLLGLVLLLIVYFQMLYRAWQKKQDWLFSSILIYGFVALTQMPTRYFPTAFLGVFLIRLSLESSLSNCEELSHN